MKWAPRKPRWRITFGCGGVPRIMVVRGDTPDAAANRVVRLQFGRRAHAKRIVGRIGEPGAFEAVGKHDEPLAVFDIDKEE